MFPAAHSADGLKYQCKLRIDLTAPEIIFKNYAESNVMFAFKDQA